MILNKEVEVNITYRNIGNYIKHGYSPIIGEKLVVKTECLPKGSNIKINCQCDVCNKQTKMDYFNYLLNTKNLTEKYYCVKCSKTKTKETFLNKYGVENASQVREIQDKKIETSLRNWGTEYGTQNKIVQEKAKKTNLEKYGVEYTFQSKNVKDKIKETCLERYGVNHHMQDSKIFKQAQKSSCKVFQYKNTDLTWQGKYEKYFLEQMEKYGFLNELSKGKSYNYELNGKQHVYHSDYWFNNSVIEIKSTWTYNRDGNNKEMELENEAKWQAVKHNEDEIIILFSKKEIKDYIESLI